jgi:Sigma-54 interaction domain
MKKEQEIKNVKNIFITWHYTTYGIAYFKHILSECFNRSIENTHILWENIAQNESNSIFEGPKKKGFLFDKIYYLTAPQPVFELLANRAKYRREIPNDAMIQKVGLTDLWKVLLEQENSQNSTFRPNLTADKRFVQTHFPAQYELFMKYLWREIHHYPIADQILWFLEDSNAKTYYNASNFAAFPTNVKSLRDVQNIANQLRPFLKQLREKYPDAQYFINLCLGSSETQIVWYALKTANLLPSNIHFLQTYDQKSDFSDDTRFNRFKIQAVPTDTFEKLALPPIYDSPQSQKRKIAEWHMKDAMTNGFAILILGERGIGKSALADKYKASKTIIVANCASFDDDNKAESELFGYKKGAFTGADKDTDGLFQKANGGILFLDEIHHLSKRVQAKLMKALQTDDKNFFRIRPMGSSDEKKIRCTIIFATNRTIQQLCHSGDDNILYEDFFDRIAQNVIELPPLRDTKEDRIEDWKNTWSKMKFGEKENAPKERAFLSWLTELPLYGNFRDLQKIALYCHSYPQFSPDLKALLPVKSEFEYAKSEFERLQSPAPKTKIMVSYFDENKSIKDMQQHFNKDLANWAIDYFGSAQKAVDYFNEKGDKTTVETLYRWRNSK